MEVDAGAAVSLISEVTQKVFTQLQNSAALLTTYTTEAIPVVGVLSVQVKYGAYTTIGLYMVEGKGPTFLGRDWLQHIRLD